nr:MAG TPA: hypothetical protein [Caudoviricetes sp.]
MDSIKKVSEKEIFEGVILWMLEKESPNCGKQWE